MGASRRLICDADLFKQWLRTQSLLHFHLRILGNGTDASWVLVRSRTALCADKTRCVFFKASMT